MRKLEGVLRDWKGRWLTFRGKASAMNVGALSKLWHVGHIVLMHPKHIKRLKSTVFDFLWQGPDRVKRSVMVASHLAGGVGLSEVELRLQSFSVVHIYKLLFAEARPKWMHFAAYFVGFHLRRWRASFASNLVQHADQVTPFYVFAFRQWQRFVEACPNWRVGVVDSRRVYGVLLDLFPERTPRVELLRENGLVSFPECWRNVACSFVDPEVKCIAAADIRRLWLGALYRRFCVDRVRLSDTGLGGVWALRGVVVERIGGEWGFVLGDGQRG